MRGDLVVAILGVGNKLYDYDDQDVETLSSLANLAWDIIERKQTDEALRESEINYRTVANYTSDWEYWMTPDGGLRYVSPSCEGITGYRVEEFKENPELLVDILHPDDRDKYREHILNNSDESDLPDYYEMDFRILNRGGEQRWIAHVCQRVYNDNGKCLGRRASNRDITKRKLAEHELARAAERDHHIAEVFQRTVMPTQLPIQPPGYEIATKYQPASQEAEVCGDFCDIFDLGDGYIGISIGDIVGKGLLAAMRVTAAKNMIRSYAFLYDRPSKVMTLVNDALCRDIAMENDMLTAFFAILDTKIGILTYSNAGHEPPLLWQASGMAKLLNVGGPMFCGLGKQVYLEGYLNLQPGDVFVTVTDGITEAGIDRCAQHYGAEGVINCMSTHASMTAEQISTAIMESAKKFANGPLRDDASVVVIKKT
jgi:PAS domain S-box-containing protein